MLDDVAQRSLITYGVGSSQNTWSARHQSEPHCVGTRTRVLTRLNDYVQNSIAKIPLLFGIDTIHAATFVIAVNLSP
jgi:hypothetical protein